MQKTKQFLLLISLSFIIALLPFSSQANDEDDLPYVELKSSNNLGKEAQLSRERQLPILIMFSMEDCTYCDFVEEEHLKPMLRSSDYARQVIIRRIMTDDFDDIIDFDGSSISTFDLSIRYHASISPTVVFLDHEGKELAPRVLGVSNTEMYGLELDEGIALSLDRIRQSLAASFY